MGKKMNGFFCGAAFVVSLGVSQSADAHIRMTMPISRHPIPEQEDNSFLKDAPCGGLGDSRTNDPARVSTFAPGETITVEWHETIHHASHYRIAFDADGQDDFSDPLNENDIIEPPVLPILLDGIADVSSGEDMFSVQVTLPTTPCDNCTLQLIQYMYDRVDPFYYQCADIVITGDPGEPTTAVGGTSSGGGNSTGGAFANPAGGNFGSGDPASTGGTSSGIATDASGGATTGMDPEMVGTSSESTGCSMGISSMPLGGRLTFFVLILFGVTSLRRKRAA